MTHSRRAIAPAARAFTMIEVLVVVALVSVTAMIVVPRLAGAGARQARVEVQAARAVVSAAAQRDALSSQATCLTYSEQTRELALLVEDVQTDPTAARHWSPAALVTPAQIETAQLRAVAIDGVPSGAASWRIDFEPSQPRPSLSLLFVYEGSAIGGSGAWQLDLPGDATAAIVTALPSAEAWRPVMQRAATDLDAQGRRNTAW